VLASMKRLNCALETFALVSLSTLVGCQNVAFVGYDESISITAQYKADPSEPVDIHAGYKNREAVAVPPKQSLPTSDAFNSGKVPQGDLLSTVSSFRVVRVNDTNGKPVAGALDIYTCVAAGSAADTITSASPSPVVGGPLRARAAMVSPPGSSSMAKGFFQRAANILNAPSTLPP
jgi:hypothetical protein